MPPEAELEVEFELAVPLAGSRAASLFGVLFWAGLVLVMGQLSFLTRHRRYRRPGRAGSGYRAGRSFGHEDAVSHRQVRGRMAVEDEHRLDHPAAHRDR